EVEDVVGADANGAALLRGRLAHTVARAGSVGRLAASGPLGLAGTLGGPGGVARRLPRGNGFVSRTGAWRDVARCPWPVFGVHRGWRERRDSADTGAEEKGEERDAASIHGSRLPSGSVACRRPDAWYGPAVGATG